MIQHPCNQSLLIVGGTGSVLQIVHCTWIGVSPAVEVFLAVGGDGTELCLVTAGGDNYLVVKEKWRTAFAFDPALFAVAHYLVDGFWNGVFYLW